MDDDSFKIVRRNLNIISTLILLLAFSNAEINKINFLGIDLVLEGKKLYIALWIFYCYFFWRYLTKLPYETKFKEAWHQFLFGHKNYEGRSYILRDYPERKLIPLFQKKFGNDFDKNLSDHERWTEWRTTIYRLPEWKLWEFRISITFVPKRNEDSKIYYFDIKRTWFYLVPKIVWFCLKYDRFGDYIFPIIPILVNLGFFAFRPSWQGSVQRLLDGS